MLFKIMNASSYIVLLSITIISHSSFLMSITTPPAPSHQTQLAHPLANGLLARILSP